MKERLLWVVGGLCLFLQLTAGGAFAYTVSGTIQNPTGNSTSRVYVVVMTPDSPSSAGFGTSIDNIPAGGSKSFTIRGVPQGTYRVAAFMDVNNTGSLHINDPAKRTAPFTMSGNWSIGTLLLQTQSPIAPTAVGEVNVVTTSNGAMVVWNAPKSPYGTNGPAAELADSYVIYWGTSPSPGNGTALGSKTVPANGSDYHVFVNNLPPNADLYFAVEAVNNNGVSRAYKATSQYYTIAAPTGGATVSGRVYSPGITKNASTPLYIVLVSDNGPSFIGGVPSPTDTQSWSIAGVQPGTYSLYVILDLTNDGVSSVIGKATSRGMNDNLPGVTVTVPPGATAATGPDITLTAPNSKTFVKTANISNQSYGLEFFAAGGLKRPVSVSVDSGPNLSEPIDLGLSLGNGDAATFGYGSPQVYFTTKPSVGDTYSITVQYSDGTPDPLTRKVTGVVTAFPSLVFPKGNVSPIDTNVTPFAWSTPGQPPAGYYDYYLGMNASSGTPPTYTRFWYPQDNGNSNMPSSQFSIPYNSDGSAPLSSLTSGTYNWGISVNDGLGNYGFGLGTDIMPQSGGPSNIAFNPPGGSAGASVTITGNGFSGATTVSFGGVPATFNVDSDTQITATVPSSAPVGPVTVRNGSGVTGASSLSFRATTTFEGSVANFSGTQVSGATVTLVNSDPVVSATTDVNGSFTITIPSGAPYSFDISKTDGNNYHDVMTATMVNRGLQTATTPYLLLNDSNLAPLGFSVADKGLIWTRVTDWDSNSSMGGATVTATSFLHPDTPYAVYYPNPSNPSNGAPVTGGAYATLAGDGRFFVPDVDEGDIITVTATLAGYGSQTRTYVTHKGVVSETRVNVTPLPVVTASPAGGSIASSQQITLTVSNPINGNAYTIKYTTDGSDPKTSGNTQTYTGPFNLNGGTVTLKFFAINTTRSVAGSVATATYTVSAQYPLYVNVTGFGQITGIANSQTVVNCSTGNTGTCSPQLDPGTQVQLTALASGDAYFSSWWNCPSPSGNTCAVTMNSQQNVNATFIAAVRLNGVDKPTIQQAFDDASSGGVVKAQARDFYDANLTMTTAGSLTLQGGYDSGYSTNAGYSILHGVLTIINGNLTVDRFSIR
jgi:hypothetical protein